MTEQPTFLGAAARWTRFALLAAIAVVLGLIVTTPKNEYPLTMSRAQADSICAAPGYLLTSFASSAADRLFLVDTQKQVICTYTVNGDKLRLIAARRFDVDTGVYDGARVVNGIRIEGGNGITRDESKAVVDGLSKMDAEKK